ncbi:MAG: FAD-binding protein [Sphingomonadales bacterium]|nr:MAG: FAD-binding protein [Sphingomonadales bacterium]
MPSVHHTKMLILGSGPAGLSAAIYAARAGMMPIVVQGLQPGGQLTITTDVENYPGFAEVVQGPWLMEQMTAQAMHVGTSMIWDTIVDVDFSRRPFKLTGDGGDVYMAETLVIATGAQAKWLGVPGEQELGGKGVSACATCDGFFYRGKKVDTVTGEASHEPTDGGFVAIGHSPATELFKGKLPLDDDGYLQITPGTSLTSIPGVFAAGDVADKIYRQAVTAAGMGCMAALDAERFLAEAEYHAMAEA